MYEAGLEAEDTIERMGMGVAQHGAAHALAHLHFSQRFVSVGGGPEGSCEIEHPVWGPDAQINARIAMVGPCVELAIDLAEDPSDALATVRNTLTTWLEDVTSSAHGYWDDLMKADQWISDASPWALAFAYANHALIDEAAVALIKAGGRLTFEAFAPQFEGRTADVDAISWEAADHTFVGHSGPLELVEEAVAKIIAGEL